MESSRSTQPVFRIAHIKVILIPLKSRCCGTHFSKLEGFRTSTKYRSLQIPIIHTSKLLYSCIHQRAFCSRDLTEASEIRIRLQQKLWDRSQFVSLESSTKLSQIVLIALKDSLSATEEYLCQTVSSNYGGNQDL